MQTFLAYESFMLSAQVLDNRRLGKQRVEGLQILQTLDKDSPSKGWRNHPAVIMWRGYEITLAMYTLAMCDEWANRGFSNLKTMPQLNDFTDKLKSLVGPNDTIRTPPWLGNEAFHRSHRAMLVWKRPDWYAPLFPDIDPIPTEKPEYIWPTNL